MRGVQGKGVQPCPWGDHKSEKGSNGIRIIMSDVDILILSMPHVLLAINFPPILVLHPGLRKIDCDEERRRQKNPYQ
jgi:hypothetical protein